MKSFAWVCCCLLAGTGSSNPAGGINAYCVSVVFFSVRGPCDWPIPRLHES